MVKTRIIKISVISGEETLKRIIVKVVKGVKTSDLLSGLQFDMCCDVVYKKTRKVLDKNADIWDLIRDDKTPELYVCARTVMGR
jgi:hypothetical protein